MGADPEPDDRSGGLDADRAVIPADTSNPLLYFRLTLKKFALILVSQKAKRNPSNPIGDAYAIFWRTR